MKDAKEAHDRIDALEGRLLAVEAMRPRVDRIAEVLGEPSEPARQKKATGLCLSAEQLLEIEAEKKADKDRVGRALAERAARVSTFSKALGIVVVGGGAGAGLIKFLLSLKGVHLP